LCQSQAFQNAVHLRVFVIHHPSVGPGRSDNAVTAAQGFILLQTRIDHLGAVFFFQMAEDGARIDAEIARGLGAIAVVELENLVDVLALKFLLGVGQLQDGRMTSALSPDPPARAAPCRRARRPS